jgi:hypothetical protein
MQACPGPEGGKDRGERVLGISKLEGDRRDCLRLRSLDSLARLKTSVNTLIQRDYDISPLGVTAWVSELTVLVTTLSTQLNKE